MVCFLMKERKKGVELGGRRNGEDLRRVGVRETIQSILYEKKSILYKKIKLENK